MTNALQILVFAAAVALAGVVGAERARTEEKHRDLAEMRELETWSRAYFGGHDGAEAQQPEAWFRSMPDRPDDAEKKCGR
jgi:hypothetical protein